MNAVFLTFDEELQFIYIYGTTFGISILDNTVVNMPEIGYLALTLGGADYYSKLTTIEHTDRFMHTKDGFDLCIISTTEG